MILLSYTSVYSLWMLPWLYSMSATQYKGLANLSTWIGLVLDVVNQDQAMYAGSCTFYNR